MYLTATEEISMLSMLSFMGVLRHRAAGPQRVTAHPRTRSLAGVESSAASLLQDLDLAVEVSVVVASS